MSTRIQKQIFLPTKGDAAIVANGTAFFDAANKWYNLAPGQIGFYNAETSVAVNAAGVAAAKTIFVAIGVGAVTGQPTKSKSVRLSNGEYLSSCLIDYANVDAPQAGTSNTASFYFSCIDCSTNYAIGIQLRDPSLNFFMPENRFQVETINVQSETCPSCDGDCNYVPDPLALEAQFVTAIQENEFLKKYVNTVVATGPQTVNGVAYEAGITITFKPNTQDCGCFPKAESIMQRYTIGSIQTVLQSGWAPNSTTVTINMAGMQMPKGIGADLQWEEYMEMPGGTGFDGLNNEVETTGAPYYAQLEVSRTKNLLVECEKTYCQYSVGHHSSSKNEDANGHNWQPNFITNILIPSTDTVTQAAVEGVLNAFVTTGPCGKTISVDCIA
jgi:hypothetical protein